MMTAQRQNRLRTIIQQSRARLMVDKPEFALVLMYFRYVATKQVYRISTNGKIIYFDPDWLQKLNRKEMDYILIHQAMHFVRDDVSRPAFFAGDRYHHACDIILNSFMRKLGLKANRLDHIGKLPHKTYFPEYEGNTLTPAEAFRAVPFDPLKMKPGQRRTFRIDSDEWWGRFGMPEDGTMILYPGYEGLSDEVVRDKRKRYLRPKYHHYSQAAAGSGTELIKPEDTMPLPDVQIPAPDTNPSEKPDSVADDEPKDDSPPDEIDTDGLDAALNRLLHMLESMERAASKQAETMERIWKGAAGSKLEWRKLLNTFLQEEVHDYSFLPPDRRFGDSEFFLPDFNERDDTIRSVLFMIDTSGSVDDDAISAVYGEICAAIEQFSGKMSGMLGFFSTDVTPPIPFCSTDELLRIRPKGFGGTDFDCIFHYIDDHSELTPSCMVIFTDGLGSYPPEEAAGGIPVLWILHGSAEFPEWGRTARIT